MSYIFHNEALIKIVDQIILNHFSMVNMYFLKLAYQSLVGTTIFRITVWSKRGERRYRVQHKLAATF